MINWARFWKTPKTQAFGQTVLPDMSFLKGQKLVENGKIEKKKTNATFLVIFERCVVKVPKRNLRRMF